MKKTFFERINSFLIVAVLLVFATGISSCQSPKESFALPEHELPNIVLIVADDIGLGDIGFYHRQRTGKDPIVETPHIDQLIQEGMRFDDAHTSASLCSPSRFGILTGNYSLRTPNPFGTWYAWKKPDIDTTRYETLATLTRNARYQTAFFGKFGVGGQFEPEKNFKNRIFGPNQIGFDYAFELPSGIQGSPFAYYENNQWMPLRENSDIIKLGRGQTRIKDKNKFIKGDSNWDPSLAGKMLSQKYNARLCQYSKISSKPFFIYYASQAIHPPYAPADSIGNKAFTNQTGFGRQDMVQELDLQVGNIIEQLKLNGVYDNTIIILTSDNGAYINKRSIQYDPTNGYRGKKGSVYEGGHRVPFIIKWTHQIHPFSKSEHLVSTLDLLPTIAELIHAPTQKPLDGQSLLPLLLGQDQIDNTPYLLHFENPGQGDLVAVRKGDWKYIFSYTKTNLANIHLQEIYNLKENPFELPNQNYWSNDPTPELKEMALEARKIWKREVKKKIR